jgi:hypothetical protein
MRAPVPLYFFHLDNGDGYVADELGQDLPDLQTARLHALKAAGQMIAEELAEGRERLHLTIFIEDAAGDRLMSLPLALSAGAS